MSKKSDKSRFVPEPVTIWLGKGENIKEYNVEPATWASLIRLKDVFRSLLNEVTELWNQSILTAVKDASQAESNQAGTVRLQELFTNEKVWELIDSLLEKPYDIFVLAIPDLDKNLFDEKNKDGATIPQVWETFNVIAEVNKLDVAKNLLAGRIQKNST
jgi:hypothetical protein